MNEPSNSVRAPAVITSMADMRQLMDTCRAQNQTVGFVPTMGYLHDGHGSLMRAAGQANDVVVISIFVNPLQFAPTEDLASYPRDLDRDVELAAVNGVGVVFHPPVTEIYPNGPVLTSVSVAELSERWDGASRPTHFAGVATVVAKLFNIVGPCRAYFGEKDFQQLAIIKRMTSDLSIPVEVIGCPIKREADGLALSSRNIYLSLAEREVATVLRRALDEGERAVEAGIRDPTEIDRRMTTLVEAEPLARLDYAAAVDAETLLQPPVLGRHIRLIIAAYLGRTRLIDNCGVTTHDSKPMGDL